VPCFYFEAVHYFFCFVATKNALTEKLSTAVSGNENRRTLEDVCWEF